MFECLPSLDDCSHILYSATGQHCLQILADVDPESADVSETCDGAGHNLLMSARHVWDEHLQRRAHKCIVTLATLHDNLSARMRGPTPPQPTATGAKDGAATTAQAAAAAGAVGTAGAAKASRAYEELKVEEWMRESRMDWESAIRSQVSELDEEIAQVRYKRQCIEHAMAMHEVWFCISLLHRPQGLLHSIT
jgi:hypothetical protein